MGVAEAHFNLLMPAPSEKDTTGGKGAPPCGSGAPSGVVTPVKGGQMLALKVQETVYHPGHYRVALAPMAQLPKDPTAVVANGQSVSAPIDPAPKLPVLADGLFVHTQSPGNVPFQTMLTIPNIDCPSCILQVIEFMAQHGPNPGGGYYYHHCAELKITADPAAGGDGGVTDTAATPDTGAAPDAPAVVDVGSSGSGGAGSGGSSPGSGGSSPGTGGSVSASGGASGSGGAAAPSASDGGGGCAVASVSGGVSVGGVGLLGLMLALGARRRRRGRR